MKKIRIIFKISWIVEQINYNYFPIQILRYTLKNEYGDKLKIVNEGPFDLEIKTYADDDELLQKIKYETEGVIGSPDWKRKVKIFVKDVEAEDSSVL